MTLWTARSRADGCGYRDAMPLRRAAAPIALLVAAALAGCAAPEPEAEPTVAPTEEPVFASEEEALAAAEEVYGAYLAASDAIFNSGTSDIERLQTLVTESLLADRRADFEASSAEGVRGVGRTEYQLESVQTYEPGSKGPRILVAYICRDVSGVDVLDRYGNSIVTKDRLDVIPMEVAWDLNDAGDLVVSRDEPWQSENFCAD